MKMSVQLMIDDEICVAEEDELLAAVLLRQHVRIVRRHPVDGSPRAPFCMMGVCFECLVEVDGITNQQACMIRVKGGMRVSRGVV